MLASLFDRLWDSSSGVATIGTVVWLVLAAITITLLVLMYTRWGRSRSIEKCAVLSLLAHALLASVSTTIHLAGSLPTESHGESPVAIAQLISDDAETMPAREARAWETSPATPDVDPASPKRLPSETEPAPVSRADAALPEPAELSPLTVDAAARRETPSADDAPPVVRRVSASELDAPGSVAQAADAPDAVEAAALERIKADAASAGEQRREASVPPVPLDVPTENATARRESDPAASALDEMPLPRRGANPGGNASTDDVVRSGGAGVEASPLPTTLPSVGRSGGAAAGEADAVPELYRGRVAPDRTAIASRGGGGRETEAAVERALKWLAAHQSADGRWDVANLEGGFEPRTAGHDRKGAGIGADTGISGLALLSFLGAGHTHLTGDHRDTVRRGLEFLLNSQDAQGNLAGDARLFARMYCHGMAALALSEALAMTGDRRLVEGVRRAAAYSSTAQHPSTGGWRYLANEQGDMSQHGWQVMLLKSAKIGGVEVSDLTLSRAARFVDSATSGQHGGLASYRPREKVSAAMTAEALVCRMFLDMRRDEPMAKETAAYLLNELPSADEPNFYYWYYGTLAMHDIRGEAWDRWNKAMREVLLSSQKTSGDATGSWDPDRIWGGYGGRTYSTALGALCLEVYYRYLPLYRGEATARK